MIKITQLINAKAARHKVKEKIYKDIAHYVIIAFKHTGYHTGHALQ